MAKAAKSDKPTTTTTAQSNESKARSRDLEMALGAITKQYGEGSIIRLGDASQLDGPSYDQMSGLRGRPRALAHLRRIPPDNVLTTS